MYAYWASPSHSVTSTRARNIEPSGRLASSTSDASSKYSGRMPTSNRSRPATAAARPHKSAPPPAGAPPPLIQVDRADRRCQPVALQRRGQEVHRRRADEAGDEEVDRLLVELSG